MISLWDQIEIRCFRSKGKSLLFQTFVVVVNVAHVPVYTRQFSLKMGWITFQMLKSTVAYSKFDSNTSVFILLVRKTVYVSLCSSTVGAVINLTKLALGRH